MTEPAQNLGHPVAAIDCGTNSIRLLVAQPVMGEHGVELEELHRQMQIVRLGENIDATGEFSEGALQRCFAAAEDFAAVIARRHAVNVRCAATSATRDAGNREEFLTGMRERLGVTPEVISGEEEAALSFAGALAALPEPLRQRLQNTVDGDSARILVVDLGGGSTEFVLGTLPLRDQAPASSVVESVSVDMGCVRYTERYLHTDPPTGEEIAAATQDIETTLNSVTEQMGLHHVDAVIGVAGTVTTITAAALGLDTYDPDAIHGAHLDLQTLDAAAATLLTASRTERESLPYMHPGRVDVIGGGALIWRTLLQRIHTETNGAVTSAVTSEHDILDGIALSLVP